MQTARAANTEPIPGYRLIEPLGRGGFGEVWKCEAPGGLQKAIKFVPGPSDNLSQSGSGAEREFRALQHIKSIRHPFLLAMDRVEIVDGDLLIVMELADKSLHDLLQDYRKAGLPGVPRGDLLGYLHEAAEVLDLINQEHKLQHLDVKPRNLFLVHGHVKVADFGLVEDLSGGSNCPDTKTRETITPIYAAPETFLGNVTLFSDQYSLAITFQELLTGTLPFTGKNLRQLALAHVQGMPDLTPLPEGDRALVAKALAKEPTERFSSCLDFIRALQAADPGPLPAVRRTRNTAADLILDELSNTAVAPGGSAGTRPALPRPSGSLAGRATLLPGFQLLECVGRLPVGEMWKAMGGDGRKRLIKLVIAPESAQNDPQFDPIAFLQEMRHDALAPMEVIPCPGNRLALVTDPGDGSLFDRMKESQQDGLPGIPRLEMLGYLRQAAEALDELHRTYHIQHLCLTPKQLVLREGRLRILDYGLMELLWMPAGFEAPALNTRYCAPELFTRQSSRVCDLYSLALIYQELLTGIHAFRNLNARQMATAKLRGQPDVGLLPAIDRPVVLKALHLDPDQRFRTCTEFLTALEAVSYSGGQQGLSRLGGIGGMLPPNCCLSRTLSTSGPPPTAASFAPQPALPSLPGIVALPMQDPRQQSIHEMRQIIEGEIAAAVGHREVRSTTSVQYALHRPEENPGELVLEAHCFGRLILSTVSLKLQGFREQWHAEILSTIRPTSEGQASCAVLGGYKFLVRLSGNFWQRNLGRPKGLEVTVQFQVPLAGGDGLTEVAVQIRAVGVPADKVAEVLGETGPPLLESLRNFLQLHTERRADARYPYTPPLQVWPLLPTHELGEPFVAQGKDISARGLGVYLPCRPTTAYVYLQFHPARKAPVAVPGRIVHYHPCPDGRFETGLSFAWDDL
jgi:serine/threonine protein kinase